MIQTSHVGVGITGAEGAQVSCRRLFTVVEGVLNPPLWQAANASDFTIGRFKFLQRLLLVHGRWNYIRMAALVLYMFYKNIVFALAQFWYSMYTGW